MAASAWQGDSMSRVNKVNKVNRCCMFIPMNWVHWVFSTVHAHTHAHVAHPSPVSAA
jgi:hypothetical protein